MKSITICIGVMMISLAKSDSSFIELPKGLVDLDNCDAETMRSLPRRCQEALNENSTKNEIMGCAFLNNIHELNIFPFGAIKPSAVVDGFPNMLTKHNDMGNVFDICMVPKLMRERSIYFIQTYENKVETHSLYLNHQDSIHDFRQNDGAMWIVDERFSERESKRWPINTRDSGVSLQVTELRGTFYWHSAAKYVTDTWIEGITELIHVIETRGLSVQQLLKNDVFQNIVYRGGMNIPRTLDIRQGVVSNVLFAADSPYISAGFLKYPLALIDFQSEESPIASAISQGYVNENPTLEISPVGQQDFISNGCDDLIHSVNHTGDELVAAVHECAQRTQNTETFEGFSTMLKNSFVVASEFLTLLDIAKERNLCYTHDVACQTIEDALQQIPIL